jgi:hypothetical protein
MGVVDDLFAPPSSAQQRAPVDPMRTVFDTVASTPNGAAGALLVRAFLERQPPAAAARSLLHCSATVRRYQRPSRCRRPRAAPWWTLCSRPSRRLKVR